MRKWRFFLCTAVLFALLPALFRAQRALPIRTADYAAKKYEGWNGVLRIWFCCEWQCLPGFTGWLNDCAAAFEKENGGVYVEIESVTAQALRDMRDSGLNLPDAVVFSAGTIDDPAGFLPIESETPLRAPLSVACQGRAIPVAMGGYTIAHAAEEAMLIALPPDGKFNYSAALIALSDDGGEIEVPEPGIDLGLPVVSLQPRFELTRSENALERFIGGDADAVLTDQYGLSRLNELRNVGRISDWTASERGRYAFTDQLLLCAVPRSSRADGEAREELALRFAQSLLSGKNQLALRSAGAFSVLTEGVYAGASPLAPLERLLISRTLIIPPCFGGRRAELSLPAEQLAKGSLTPEDAVARLSAAFSNGT